MRTTKPQIPPSMRGTGTRAPSSSSVHSTHSHDRDRGHRQHNHHHGKTADPYDIFKKFFGTQDFRQASSMADGGFSFLDTPSSGHNASRETTPAVAVAAEAVEEREEKDPVVDEPIVKNFYCSLEDL